MCREVRVHGTQSTSPEKNVWQTEEKAYLHFFVVLVEDSRRYLYLMEMAVLDFPKGAVHSCVKFCAQQTKCSKFKVRINYVLNYLQIVHHQFSIAGIIWGNVKG